MGFRAQTVVLVMATALRSASTLLIPIVLTRILPAAQFGRFRSAQVVAAVVGTMAMAGLPQTLLYLIPTSEAGRRRQVLGLTLTQLSAAALVAALVLLAFAGPLAGSLEALDSARSARLAALLVVGLVFSQSGPMALVAIGRLRASSWLEAIIGVGAVIATMVPVVLGRGPEGAIAGLGLFHLVAGAAAWILLAPGWPAGLGLSVLRKQWSLALPQGLNSALGSVSQQADKLIVAALFLPGAFAVYACGAIEVPLVTLFPYVLTRAVAPRLAAAHAEGETESFLSLWHKVVRPSSLVTAFSMAVLFVGADFVIGILFPPEYAAAVVPFRIMLFILLLRLSAYGLVLQATGRALPSFVASLAGLLATIILAVALVPAHGPAGAAWGAVAGQALSSALHLEAIRRQLGVGWSRVLPWPWVLRVLVAAGSAMAAGWEIRAGAVDPAAALIAAAITGVVFVTAAWLLGLARVVMREIPRAGRRRRAPALAGKERTGEG